jgi:predicted enzyme related to lactoylglutathione lyase
MATFCVRAVTIAPGDERPYDAAEWCDAIVSVERGELELECVSGARRRFGRGSLIWLCDLPLRALRSTGSDPVLLVAVSRGDDFAPPRVSLRLDTRSSRKEAHAMGGMFVWFDLRSKDVGEAGDFYEKLLGWNVQGQEGHSMIAGDSGPWAAIVPHQQKDSAWVPYVQVEDVDAATARAAELGATVLHEAMDGPAGRYSTIRDTGGAPIALWQPAAA